MKIYFAGSISSGRQDVTVYQKIISILKQYGQVLTEFIGDSSLSEKGEDNISDKEIHDRDLNWLLSADLVVAEVSNPSLGVGYEIARALENGIRVICLYKKNEEKRLSAMIKGASGVKVIIYENINDLEELIKHVVTNPL
jgi:2'-deoxynucleoside 5'-phosphate N-hydrolase